MLRWAVATGLPMPMPALGWASNTLLATAQDSGMQTNDYPLRHFDALAGITDGELIIMQSALNVRAWKPGEVVFPEGDASSELFLITHGAASLRLHMADVNRSMRLVTLSPGTLFGELALLDQGSRSATVAADSDLRCYVMTYEPFTHLRADHPALAIRLMSNLGRELSSRLRRATRTIYQLEG